MIYYVILAIAAALLLFSGWRLWSQRHRHGLARKRQSRR